MQQQQADTSTSCIQLATDHPLVALLCMQSGNTTGTLLMFAAHKQQTTQPASPTQLAPMSSPYPQADRSSSNSSSGSSSSNGGNSSSNSSMGASAPTLGVGASGAATGGSSSTSSSSSGMARQKPMVYRVRLTGPEILQPPVQYCGSMAAAAFTLTAPGSYNLALLRLYQDFSFEQPPYVLEDIHAARYDLFVPQAAVAQTSLGNAVDIAAGLPLPSMPVCLSKQAARGSSSSSKQGAPGAHAAASNSTNNTGSSSSSSSCPTCLGHSHPGRWVAADGADPHALQSLLTALQQPCVFKARKPYGPYYDCPLQVQAAATPDVEDRPVLQWQPYRCSYSAITPAVAAQCKAALRRRQQQQIVCFMGDSQMRHLFNQVVHLLAGPAAGFRKEVSGMTRAYQVLKDDVLYYFADNYGNNTVLRWDTGNCSQVFINFGQWPLSHAEKTHWPAQRYAQGVQRVAARMVAQRQRHGNQQYWLTSNPAPLVEYHQHDVGIKALKGVDRRTDPFSLLFNKVASTVMQAHDIPVVDTYSIAAPLFDVSYDAGHYLGTVGLAQATMVAHIICDHALQQSQQPAGKVPSAS